jgi:GTP cyclohydrolase I
MIGGHEVQLMNEENVAKLIEQLLKELGEDPGREGLANTPARVAKAYSVLLSGYNADPEEIVGQTTFAAETNDMVILRDIEVYSLCEHHMLPFYGKCHIGYIPGKRIIGVSKLARVVDSFARRLQIQERLTSQIAHAVLSAVDAKGVGVVLECRHLCMMMRGVEKQNSVMTTSSVLGSFRESEATRLEFLSLIKQG